MTGRTTAKGDDTGHSGDDSRQTRRVLSSSRKPVKASHAASMDGKEIIRYSSREREREGLFTCDRRISILKEGISLEPTFLVHLILEASYRTERKKEFPNALLVPGIGNSAYEHAVALR